MIFVCVVGSELTDLNGIGWYFDRQIKIENNNFKQDFWLKIVCVCSLLVVLCVHVSLCMCVFYHALYDLIFI